MGTVDGQPTRFVLDVEDLDAAPPSVRVHLAPVRETRQAAAEREAARNAEARVANVGGEVLCTVF